MRLKQRITTIQMLRNQIRELTQALRDIEMETREGGQFDAKEVNHIAKLALDKVQP
jgi:uncharacterized protein (UPF0335 family)